MFINCIFFLLFLFCVLLFSLLLSLQPNHLNLDFERPHFEGIDIHHQLIEASKNGDEIKKYVTYEELQRKNREQYALKHTKYS